MARKSDFTFIQMWPRDVFKQMDGRKLRAKAPDSPLRKPGVYILYRDDEPYYVGQATRRTGGLFERLHDHANKMTDRYYFHWNFFSCFAFPNDSRENKKKIAEIERILIAALPRTVNSATPRLDRETIPPEMRKALKKSAGV